MNERDRLIELLDYCWGIEGYGMGLVEKFADYLLANGVMVKPVCAECVFDDGLNWHQCEVCIGDKSNKFVPLADFSNDFDQ